MTIFMLSITYGISYGQEMPDSLLLTPSMDTATNDEARPVTTQDKMVALPLIKRHSKGVEWNTNRILNVRPNGNGIAFIANQNGVSDIYVLDIANGHLTQLTNMNNVIDFSYSNEGNAVYFTSQTLPGHNETYRTIPNKAYIVEQLTSGYQDYSPTEALDMSKVFFTRMVNHVPSIWSKNLEGTGLLTKYTIGMNPVISGEYLYFTRKDVDGHGEIWRQNLSNGTETRITSGKMGSFFSPALSPDGSKIVMTGASETLYLEEYQGIPEEETIWNTDIYICNADGSELQKLTSNTDDDLSPAWSPDGKYIYFVRGEKDSKTAKIMKIEIEKQHN